jgi:hypothetical protein
VSDYGITWIEIWDDRELMKLEGAEAINQLQELSEIAKYPQQKIDFVKYPQQISFLK